MGPNAAGSTNDYDGCWEEDACFHRDAHVYGHVESLSVSSNDHVRFVDVLVFGLLVGEKFS